MTYQYFPFVCIFLFLLQTRLLTKLLIIFKKTKNKNKGHKNMLHFMGRINICFEVKASHDSSR